MKRFVPLFLLRFLLLLVGLADMKLVAWDFIDLVLQVDLGFWFSGFYILVVVTFISSCTVARLSV